VTQLRTHTIIFTHGHVDHCFGLEHYLDEAKEKGWPPPHVVAHEAVEERFRRYRETVGYNSIINSRQFQAGRRRVPFPSQFPSIDIVYRDKMKLLVGGVEVQLRHGRGETDDHTWVYFPDTAVLCPGDLIFWCVPNAGNPQKVQRYAREWAIALREMAALEPEILAPGHGWPVIGKDRVRQVLEDNATILEIVHDRTVALMNQGATLDDVIHSIQVPDDLLSKPYLRSVYDEPEFIARNVWRLYGGWYDGIPSHLKPAPERIQAEEIARLAGGTENIAKRAQDLAGRLGLHGITG
jgi:alkyl sulfatase BDS1-like metallo-beta-lactamase superfamily hydrolase